MLSRQEGKDLSRKIDRNSNDILELYQLLEKTDKKVDNLTTDVSGLRSDVTSLQIDVTGLRTDVTGLQTDVTGLRTDVTGLQTDVTGLRTDIRKLDNRIDKLDAKLETGFNSLRQLLAPSQDKPRIHHGDGVMYTPQEKRLGPLDEEIDIDSRRAFAKELERHNRIFDVYDKRFDGLDNQMAEVLEILRGKAS